MSAASWSKAEIMALLSVSDRFVELWTKDARREEKEALEAKIFDLWLDCLSEREIEEQVSVTQKTINNWLSKKRTDSLFTQPPASWQHFDVWNFNRLHFPALMAAGSCAICAAALDKIRMTR